jgi:N utilization substance protein B
VRRLARERALQCLFGLDFTQYPWDEVIEEFWQNNPARPNAKLYAERLIRGVYERLPELDAEIAEALHNWTPERVGGVERAALRMALFEMRHVDDVPPNVAINEALEVVKKYGPEEAVKFVNAVLDRLRRRLNEEAS